MHERQVFRWINGNNPRPHGFDGKRIVHDLPSYAPDLTPDAWGWRHATHIGTACPTAVADRITAPLTEMARRPALIRSFSRHPRVLYISAC